MALDKSAQSEVTVALLGGGYTLQQLAERLKSASFVITSREADRCRAWSARGWQSHRVSLEDQASVLDLFKSYPRISTVIDSVPPLRSASDPAGGVRRVVQALKGTQVKRVIYLSTTGVFGGRRGEFVDESSPAAPWNPQGEARWLSEQAYRESGLAVTVLRLPAIYGPDRGVVWSLRNGSYRLVGTGETWTNRIHVEDLVSVLERCLTGRDLPPVLAVGDDYPAQAKEVVEYICTRESLPAPASVTEEEVLRAGAYTMLSNQRVRNILMKSVLELELKYPSFREGIYGRG